MDREIEFNITKGTSQWWPRLIADHVKPAWLKLDFDKWKSEEDEDDDEIQSPKVFPPPFGFFALDERNRFRFKTIFLCSQDFSQQLKEIYSPEAESKMQGIRLSETSLLSTTCQRWISLCLISEEAYRKVYLFMFNVFLFGGFTVVVIMLLFYVLRDGQGK